MGIVTSIVGAAVSIGGGLLAADKAKKQARNARDAKQSAQAALNSVKESRQEIINPYAGANNLSSMAQDLSSNLNNPFAQLGVATQAAEIQIEQSDIALANTLDTLRATGAGAGGATALAQAALQSKKGVAASIEGQEAQNEKLRAQGEATLNQQKMSEQQRLQNISIAEGQRLQTADAAGKQFEFQAQENRTNADLDAAAGQIAQAAQAEASANQAQASAYGGMLSAVGGIASSAIGAYTPSAPGLPSPASTTGFVDAMDDLNQFNVGELNSFNPSGN
jgi:hypothetical protein